MKVKDIRIATQKIAEFPDSHGYSDSELKEIEEFNKVINNFSVNINGLLEASEAIRNLAQKAHQTFIEFQKRVNELSYFSKHDWFVSLNVLSEISFSEIIELSQSDKNKVDSFLIHWFEKNKSKVFIEAVNKYPHRKSQFKELENGYNYELYASVIVLAYSIVDGITNETLGFSFFDAKEIDGKHHLKIKSHLESLDGFVSYLSKYFFIDRYELTKHYGKFVRNSPTDSYNRHLVIHGHSYDYGSKINAIRALLLMDFIVYLSSSLKSTDKS